MIHSTKLWCVRSWKTDNQPAAVVRLGGLVVELSVESVLEETEEARMKGCRVSSRRGSGRLHFL